ncbi:MAG: DUF3341 domain-containing protein [Deltaproteobacteria bacterium]|nr:DUF3341 domain-containing protein [Deltaproteobacteria bacterium]
MEKAVLGLFTYADELLDAAKGLKASGYDITIFSPVPLNHEIEHKIGARPNPIKYFTFIGSVVGLFFGLALTLGTAAMYVLPRGGRPIWFMTPALLMSYETTILIGVFFTLVSFLFFSKLPSFKKKIYDPEIAVDSFGLLIDGNIRGKHDEVERILKEYGASEVKRVEETCY